jgi:hypothetical protein
MRYNSDLNCLLLLKHVGCVTIPVVDIGWLLTTMMTLAKYNPLH